MTTVNWESAAANTIIQIIPHLRNGSEITEKIKYTIYNELFTFINKLYSEFTEKHQI